MSDEQHTGTHWNAVLIIVREELKKERDTREWTAFHPVPAEWLPLFSEAASFIPPPVHTGASAQAPGCTPARARG